MTTQNTTLDADDSLRFFMSIDSWVFRTNLTADSGRT